ncbi:hypothetical protein [Agrobacterium vitis]|uniref:hypothetical protein n=2 Tax=Agrobacterium vitis TaxID=373 RepID=UPI0012E79393|nr:hypothetical protein [Agrobacterium vitis]NTA32349.1 hypothetical protein [Agrobacterium vitis]
MTCTQAQDDIPVQQPKHQAMPFTSGAMLSHPRIHPIIRLQAEAFLKRFEEHPQIARVFASHQRWLLGQIALMQYFEAGQILPARYFDFVEATGVASRNTADAFLKEMETYGIARETTTTDRRSRPLVPSEASLASAAGWMEIHLRSLDGFDDGARLQNFEANGRDMSKLHPLIASAFMQTPELREQPKIFDPFVWLNNGNIIIDWLMAKSQDTEADAEQILIGTVSIQTMAETFHLSRSHLTRKLLDAANVGTIGWKGRRGRSELWVSNQFRREYERAQTVKLEIIDAACAKCGLL